MLYVFLVTYARKRSSSEALSRGCLHGRQHAVLVCFPAAYVVIISLLGALRRAVILFFMTEGYESRRILIGYESFDEIMNTVKSRLYVFQGEREKIRISEYVQ